MPPTLSELNPDAQRGQASLVELGVAWCSAQQQTAAEWLAGRMDQDTGKGAPWSESGR